ncbi:MAG: glutamine synthetase [Pseudomonadota bacterium]|nr:glutamine synthetase [Pseudomonadota bacterium]
MNAIEVTNANQAREIIEERGLSHVKVGLFDVDGVLRGKYMGAEKFLSTLDKGFAFCDVVLGWDSDDQLYDNVSYTGWHTGYPDAPVRIVPESCREVPFEGHMLLFLAEFADQAEPHCPRGLLRRVIERGKAMGLSAFGACEFEFFLFNETPLSVREKEYRNLVNITPGNFGYSMLRSSVEADFYHELLETCDKMDFPLEGLHTETGPGVLEAAIKVDEIMNAADKGALFKTFTKVLAQRRGWIATFMAKWSPEWAGQSGHLHISLQDRNGDSMFYAADNEHTMSDNMRWFIGGQEQLMPELLAMVASTVNSYTRLVPGFWAPTASSWGVENRTCALRAITGSANSQRVEYRVAAADINPYIALAAALGSGLWGIENKIEPNPPVAGNAYEHAFPPEQQLPRSLMEAAGRLRESKAARELFGDAFVDHFAASREWEEREFRKAITDWELQRYFEII